MAIYSGLELEGIDIQEKIERLKTYLHKFHGYIFFNIIKNYK